MQNSIHEVPPFLRKGVQKSILVFVYSQFEDYWKDKQETNNSSYQNYLWREKGKDE